MSSVAEEMPQSEIEAEGEIGNSPPCIGIDEVLQTIQGDSLLADIWQQVTNIWQWIEKRIPEGYVEIDVDSEDFEIQCALAQQDGELLIESLDIPVQKRIETQLRIRNPSVPRDRKYWYVGEWDGIQHIENPLVVLDLCSGLGGFSEAFVGRVDAEGYHIWRVYRFDLEPYFANPEVADANLVDLLELRAEHLPYRPDLIVFSPPCTCFSVASVSHYWPDYKPNEQAQLHIGLLEHGLRLIQE